MHEGIDIRALKRDKNGEPSDPILATADGVVVYFSKRPSLSNYGIYLVLRHQVEGLEIYSLYAHLKAIEPGLAIGASVTAGQQVAIMGRTTNTREGIGKERAHLHFELNFVVNDRFPIWCQDQARTGVGNFKTIAAGFIHIQKECLVNRVFMRTGFDEHTMFQTDIRCTQNGFTVVDGVGEVMQASV